MILVIDNYDSFVYNLARYFELAGKQSRVVRNDAISVQDALNLKPEAIVISPGPCAPAEAGICVDLIKAAGATIPVLGVCLGHQCIGEAYGGETVQTNTPMHGKNCDITHDGRGLFQGLRNPLSVGRYHSLITHVPEQIELGITARDKDNIVMAVRHNKHPVYGVQFHPESILTESGQKMIENFLTLAKDWHRKARAA